uniref:Uncharacterized protein n=1 Tax=Anguilla anguilla TaxID=7936 RepID=A0A0E9XP92_ANGAN
MFKLRSSVHSHEWTQIEDSPFTDGIIKDRLMLLCILISFFSPCKIDFNKVLISLLHHYYLLMQWAIWQMLKQKR